MAETASTARPKPSGRSASLARPEPSLTIVETRILRGPNYWAREPVVRMLVDLGSLEEFPEQHHPRIVDALVELLPSLEDHACSLGRRGGFITRLQDGTWAGDVAEHIALELEPGRDRRPSRQDALGRRLRPLQRDLRVPRGVGGIEAGRIAVGLVNHLVDPPASST